MCQMVLTNEIDPLLIDSLHDARLKKSNLISKLI